MLVVWSPKSHALFWQILVSDIYKHVHAMAAAMSLRNKNHPQQIWAATIFKTSNCDHKHHSASTSVSTVIKGDESEPFSLRQWTCRKSLLNAIAICHGQLPVLKGSQEPLSQWLPPPAFEKSQQTEWGGKCSAWIALSTEQWRPAPNPAIITLMRLISELAAVKCQGGKEEANQDGD